MPAPPAPPAFADYRDAVTGLARAGEPFAELEAAIERTDLDEDAKSALWLIAFFLEEMPKHASGAWRAHASV